MFVVVVVVTVRASVKLFISGSRRAVTLVVVDVGHDSRETSAPACWHSPEIRDVTVTSDGRSPTVGCPALSAVVVKYDTIRWNDAVRVELVHVANVNSWTLLINKCHTRLKREYESTNFDPRKTYRC